MRPLCWCSHTSSARVSGLYLGLIRLRSGLGNRASSARSQDPGMKVPERPLDVPKNSQAVPLSHLRPSNTREHPQVAQASPTVAIPPASPRSSSQSAMGYGRGFTFESRAGPSIFRLLGLKWVGLRRGRGGARTGHKPVLARLKTRKTPAEPAAGAAATEAAGAAAFLPPASQSRLLCR